jgi:hypothetical protein
VEDSFGEHKWIRVSFPLDVISFPLFNYCTLNSGIVINNFFKTLCCMKWTKNYKSVLIIGF